MVIRSSNVSQNDCRNFGMTLIDSDAPLSFALNLGDVTRF
jgi:hypothetical protein